MAKRYKCPYCELRDERKKLITHIDKKHEEMLPEGYDGARIVYDMINHTNGHGTCRICKKDTQWNSSSQRYDILCGNPKCKEAMREEYKKNMLRVKGTYNILNDPEQQQKMLANRKISGKYKYSDGTVFTYTGSYEKKLLEFEDAVMNIPSKDIMMPGPTIEYMYKGEKHFYIADQLYIPYNLIIEIKDGGDNKNGKMTTGMIASREKTIEKEKVITDKGEYNYLRLTNNDFVQLIEIFMELKENYMSGNDSKVIRIHESTTDVLEKIKEFNKELATYEYIIVDKDNNVIENIKRDSYNNYETLSPARFNKFKGGICWDYVAYESQYFKSKFPEVKFKTFFFATVKNNIINHTHTFLLFYLNNKVYWFEDSWKSHIGIIEYNNENDALSHIVKLLKNNKDDWFVVEYKCSNKFMRINEKTYLNYMVELPEYKFKENKNLNKTIIQNFKLTNNGKISESYILESSTNKISYIKIDNEKEYRKGQLMTANNESFIDPKVVEIANYINENFIFNEDYFNVKIEPISNNTYLIAEYIIGENNLDMKKLSDSFSVLKEKCNTDQYGLCMIKESNNNKYNLYLTDINVFKESISKGPKKCPECGGKVGVFIEGEPIYKCVECGKYLGVVPCHLGKKKK